MVALNVSPEWVAANTNRPLRSREEVTTACSRLIANGLPLHPDHPKNWDNLLALAHVAATTDKLSLVMDAGGTRESAFLPGLHKLGYPWLLNVNRDEERSRSEGGICYHKGDITCLSQRPVFVACLSVMEHGVDIRAFFREMGRVIVSGGYLFVSFDYWHGHIDCGDRVAFGAPVRIFSSSDALDMIGIAEDHHLHLTGDADFSCEEHVVSWLGLDFTFMNLLFRRL